MRLRGWRSSHAGAQGHPVTAHTTEMAKAPSGAQARARGAGVLSTLNSRMLHTPARVLTRTAHPMQVAIGAVFLAYALRGGQVRVLDLQLGTRALLRGHKAAVSDVQVRCCARAL